MTQDKTGTGLDKPCELPLQHGRLLLIGTGAIGVANLPGWCTALKQWYTHDIQVLLTDSAQRLVATPSVAAACGSQPITSGFTGHPNCPVPHRQLAEWPDLVIVAPATLSFISRTALMIPDTLATYTAMLTSAPVVIASSVPGRLWRSQRVQEYAAELRERGWEVLAPSTGIAVSDSSIDDGALPSIYNVLRGASRKLAEGTSQ